MKTIKFFLVINFFFLFTPLKIYAAQTGQKSFFASLPIIPLVILFLLLIVSGIIVYLQLKKEKETPYGLPVSKPAEPPTPPTLETQPVTPPVQSYTETSQEPSSLIPEVPQPPPIASSVTPTSPTPTPKAKFAKPALIFLAFVFLIAGVTGGVYLLRQRAKRAKILVVSQYQCTSGCNGQVCDQEAADRHYDWCSKNKRCRCTGVGTAEAYPDDEQYWCEGNNTMYCGEITPGNCGSKVDSSNRKNCGGGPGTTCTHYRDCFNKVECEWTASTYCVNGQCACADVGQQQQIAASHPGWAVCQDTQPKCTPGDCPSGWTNCGLNYEATDKSGCEKKVKCGPVSCDGCGNTYVVWRYCKQAGGTPPPSPSKTPTPIPSPTPTISCQGLTLNGLTEKNITASIGEKINASGQVSDYGLIRYGKTTSLSGRVWDSVNPQTIASGNNSLAGSFTPTEAGIYVVEVNAYESDQCGYLCSAGKILYKNTAGTGGCETREHWNDIGKCVSDNCIKYVTVAVTPVCKGIRALLNHDGIWTDMTVGEKVNLPPGTVVRVALPVVVNGQTAEKAEFHAYNNGVAELQRDTTTIMALGGVDYYYIEFTTRYTSVAPVTYSSYTIDGWLSFNGIWY